MTSVLDRARRLMAGRNSRPVNRQEPADWRVMFKGRALVAASVMALWGVVIQGRLVFVQVADRADLEARARDQQEREIKTLPIRGEILDRNGVVLATSTEVDSIYVDPSKIPDKPAAAGLLCTALQDCTRVDREELLKLFGKGNQFAWVKRHASPEQTKRVKALNLKYVYYRTESGRSYPNGELAAHVLGYVGRENEGLGGIESTYNTQIRGVPGRVIVQTDANGHAFNRVEEPPVKGSSIELTIDRYLQHVAERELHQAVVENHAAAGSAIVMRVGTGEILAMASEPTFDPNQSRKPGDDNTRNRAVQDAYEPGSTFKLVTASAAIERHVMPIETMINTAPGWIRVSSAVYHDTANHGVLSFSDVIADSSNVGAIKVGLKVGAAQLFEFVQRYGFGRPVSRDFRGENAGRVYPLAAWKDMALASMSIGYQVSVTPLQLLAAVSSIANDGEYVEPRVVRAMYVNGRRQVERPNIVRRSIASETAAVLTNIMEGVVDHGTGTKAQIPGFTIAGKTGTASKVINGRYSSFYNASFVGFVPSTKPELAIIVVVDSPRVASYYGGIVSAPAFQRIAVAALRYLGVAPTVNPAPPVLLARSTNGRQMPDGSVQLPAMAEDSAPNVSLVVDVPEGTLPDLHGMSLREANRALIALGVTSNASGDGFVVSQNPPPGSPLGPGIVCRLELARTADRIVSLKRQ